MATAVEATTTTPANGVSYLRVDELVPAPDNPRKDLGDLTELAETIKNVGVLEPLVAIAENGHHVVLLGNRRLAAAKLAGVDVVPVIVRDDLDQTARTEVMLIENLQRADLTPLEEARAYQRLVELGLTQRQLAGRIGRSQSHVSKRLALLELPDTAVAKLDSGGITIDDALALVKLAKHPKRLASAIKDGARYHGGVQDAVRRELDELTREGELQARRAELEEAGVTIIEFVERPNSYMPPQLPANVAQLVDTDWWDGIKMTAAKHAKFDCHAAAVDPRSRKIIYLCTKPSAHPKEAVGRFKQRAETANKAASEKEKERAERAKEHARQLRARETNVELGQLLEEKLGAPKIDETNMRVLAELLMFQLDGDLGLAGFRYTDEASQTVVTKKDGSVSRVVHVQTQEHGRALIAKRLKAAKTPEQIMGVVLQALLAARHADTNAVPPSQRYTSVRGLGGYDYYGVHGACKPALAGLGRLAARLGLGKARKR